MGGSSGVSAFIKHEGANSGVTIGSGIAMPMNTTLRENRGSDPQFANFLRLDLPALGSGVLMPPGNPPSQRNSRGSNEFNPRIIMSNSIKNSGES